MRDIFYISVLESTDGQWHEAEGSVDLDELLERFSSEEDRASLGAILQIEPGDLGRVEVSRIYQSTTLEALWRSYDEDIRLDAAHVESYRRPSF